MNHIKRLHMDDWILLTAHVLGSTSVLLASIGQVLRTLRREGCVPDVQGDDVFSPSHGTASGRTLQDPYNDYYQ